MRKAELGDLWRCIGLRLPSVSCQHSQWSGMMGADVQQWLEDHSFPSPGNSTWKQTGVNISNNKVSTRVKPCHDAIGINDMWWLANPSFLLATNWASHWPFTGVKPDAIPSRSKCVVWLKGKFTWPQWYAKLWVNKTRCSSWRHANVMVLSQYPAERAPLFTLFL